MIGWIIYVIKSIYTTLYIIFTSWTWVFVIFYITGMTLDLSSIVWFLFCECLKNKYNQSIKIKITVPKSLYDSANVNFKPIEFDYYDKNEHKTHSENLEKRYSKEELLTSDNTTISSKK